MQPQDAQGLVLTGSWIPRISWYVCISFDVILCLMFGFFLECYLDNQFSEGVQEASTFWAHNRICTPFVHQ